MIYPTIHMGGTARETLERDYLAALDAVRDAVVALKITAPHARDYPNYPIEEFTAKNEHIVRVCHLVAVEAELELLLDHIINME